MDAISRKRRLQTSHATLAALSIWAHMQKEHLDNKSLAHIAAKAREAHNGQVITTKAVQKAIEAAGITLGEAKRGKGHKQFDRSAIVATALLAIVARVEKAIGAAGEDIITADERNTLGLIARRTSLKATRDPVGS